MSEASQNKHLFCGVSEEAMRAMYTVNVPAAMTLEGLAAVISALSAAAQVLNSFSRERRDVESAINKAAAAVTALLSTDDEDVSIGSPSMVMTKEETVALYAEHLKQHQRADFPVDEAKRHAEHVAAHAAARESLGQVTTGLDALDAAFKSKTDAEATAAKAQSEADAAQRAEDLRGAYNAAIHDALGASYETLRSTKDNERELAIGIQKARGAIMHLVKGPGQTVTVRK